MSEKINAISETRRRALLGLAVLGLSHITTRTWALELDATSHAQPSAALTDAQAQEQLWDVIVVGSGLAGSASALAALEAGATRVLLLEKGPIMGGHSAYSTGSLTAVRHRSDKKGNARASQTHDATGSTTDSDWEAQVESLWTESREVGGQSADEALIRKLGRDSEAAVAWLEAHGVRFSPAVFQSLGGLAPRSIIARSAQPGLTYTRALYEAARAQGLLVWLNARLTGLKPLQSDATKGWTLEVARDDVPVTLHARSVVLATGGFMANSEMLRSVAPWLPPNMRTTANPKGLYFDGAEGDGIRLAQSVGAALKDMENVQLMPLWGGRLLDYVGGDIFLNAQGQRFVNEGASWKTLEEAMLRLPEQTMWVVTDAQSNKGLSLGVKLADGTVKKSDTVAEMALGMGIDAAVLQKTLNDYNRWAKEGRDPLFGKTAFTQTIDKPPYYWGKEQLFMHTTLGGVAINARAQVLRDDGSVLPGLYAAGETVGGLFGKSRLGGLAMTACVVFGREAGRQAARYAQSAKGKPQGENLSLGR